MSALELVWRDPLLAAHSAAAAIKQRTGVAKHDVGVILGTGWDDLQSKLGVSTAEFPAADIPGFLPPTVENHFGRICNIEGDGRNYLIFAGRKHGYEVHEGQRVPVAATVHAVRTAAAAGCKILVLTNAVGGVHAHRPVGTLVMVRDHISWLVPPPLDGPIFLQCGHLYSRRLRAIVQSQVRLDEVIYLQIPGPMFETPAEYAVARLWGADTIGMSVATESIVGNERGMEVLAMSVITDVDGDEVTHDNVVAMVRQTIERYADNLVAAIRKM